MAALDPARLLRVLLPAAAARQPRRSGAAVRDHAGLRLRSAAWRAEYSARYRGEHTAPRVGVRCRPVPHQRSQLSGPRCDRYLGHLRPAHGPGGDHRRHGSDRPLAPPVSHGATSDRLLESDRPRDRPHHRRSAGVRPLRLLPARSRSAEHADVCSVANAALAYVGHAGLPVRLRLSQRQRPRPPAAAFHIRFVDRQADWRNVDDFGERREYRQHPISAGYQQHFRWDALHQSPADLWGGALPVPFLRDEERRAHRQYTPSLGFRIFWRLLVRFCAALCMGFALEFFRRSKPIYDIVFVIITLRAIPPFSDQVCRILEKVTLDLADSRATGFSEDATKTVFRFRLQHVALCCIGVTPGGGRVQESKNGRAKLDANLAGLGGAQNQRWHSATPDHENIQFSNNVGTRASYEDGPEIPCSQFPKQ